jgi:hypothetical protein
MSLGYFFLKIIAEMAKPVQKKENAYVVCAADADWQGR